MSDNAYIKVTVNEDVKKEASKHIQETTGLALSQWLRSKVYEAADKSKKDK